ncbi:MAG TPA: hypothetical protein VK636_17425 [Gemmatimonadaceae bacterium]|nr:hypothetical protein [Gemmatimonadaceae bacterium]
MTDSNRSMNEVPALVAERRRYEGWLAALDARRDTTPGHVFERVQADYRSRLNRVDEQLESHRQAIEEERASVQSRLSLCQAEEQMARDERAELELRAHVGELSGESADESFRTVDEMLEHLVAEGGGLTARIAELDALLEIRSSSGATSAPVATDVQADGSAESTADARAEEMAHAATLSDEPHADHPSGAAIASPKSDEPIRPSFDELAFLNTVVGPEDHDAHGPRGAAQTRAAEHRRDSGVVRNERPAESLLASLTESGRDPGAEAPLAANVTANQPIVLKGGAMEGSKTLKCGECGSMNYPTEWYCERCGAELAAL